MDFRVADTFTDCLAKLTGEEQKSVKTTAFVLQLNPVNPGMGLHVEIPYALAQLVKDLEDSDGLLNRLLPSAGQQGRPVGLAHQFVEPDAVAGVARVQAVGRVQPGNLHEGIVARFLEQVHVDRAVLLSSRFHVPVQPLGVAGHARGRREKEERRIAHIAGRHDQHAVALQNGGQVAQGRAGRHQGAGGAVRWEAKPSMKDRASATTSSASGVSSGLTKS